MGIRRQVCKVTDVHHTAAATLLPGALIQYRTGYVGIFQGMDSAATGSKVVLDTGSVWELPAASALTGAIGAEVGWDADGGDGTGVVVAAGAGDHNGLFLTKAKTSGQLTVQVCFRARNSDIDTDT